MEIPSTERKIRRRLRIVRYITAYVPLKLLQKLVSIDAKRVNYPDDLIHEEITANGVKCEWIHPVQKNDQQTLLYLHGGGFVFGISSQHHHLISHLAQKMNINILLVDYRLAPENPFPAALDDCYHAYHWLLNQGINPENIVVAGDSAGGNLTITTLMKLRDNGDPLPAAAACLSPVADMTERDVDFYDLIIHPRAAKRFKSYVPNGEDKNPLISPIYGDWNNLPPLLIHAGEDEMLKEDALRIKDISDTVNTEIYVELYSRMWHVWQIFLELPQSIKSLERISEFLLSHCS